jgi:hypothetical protein
MDPKQLKEWLESTPVTVRVHDRRPLDAGKVG